MVYAATCNSRIQSWSCFAASSPFTDAAAPEGYINYLKRFFAFIGSSKVVNLDLMYTWKNSRTTQDSRVLYRTMAYGG